MATAACLLPLAHAAGSFMLSSPSIEPGGTLPDTHVFNDSAAMEKTSHPR
jgi:hypothetical protein